MTTLAPSFLIESALFLAGNKYMYESLDEFKFRPDTTLIPTLELSALEHLKN